MCTCNVCVCLAICVTQMFMCMFVCLQGACVCAYVYVRVANWCESACSNMCIHACMYVLFWTCVHLGGLVYALMHIRFSSVQLLSPVQLFPTPWTVAHKASLSITNSWSLLKLMSLESVMPSNHVIIRHPLLLPSIFPSTRVFSNESVLHIRWTKYWSFNFSISPSNEYLQLISFRIDWLDLLAVQGTLKSLLQHHSSKASILLCSAFFIVQLSHPYMTTGKIIALTRRTFVGKVMPLLFNKLCGFVIAFLPRSKRLLISWLQSPFAVILEPTKIKSLTVSPSICHEMMGQMPWS